MNKNNQDWNEESIEKLLMDLPAIEDQQKKEDIFHKVQLGLQEQQSKKLLKKQRWFIPSAASAAVIAIFIILLPSVFDDGQRNDITIQNESSAPSDSANTMDDRSESELEPSEESNTNMMMSVPSEEVTDSNEEGYLGPVQEVPEGSDVVTIALPNREAQFTVPITIIVPKNESSTLDQVNKVMETINNEELGLLPSPLSELTFKESNFNATEKKVIIDVPLTGLESLSSAEVMMLKQSILETFSALDYQYVELTTEGAPGVVMGPFAEEEGFPLQEINRGYYLYTSETGHKLLVRGAAVSAPMENENGEPFSFVETIEQMKVGNIEMGYEAVIPSELTILDTREQEQLLTIVIEAGSIIEDNDRTRAMVDAILFTAKDFGFSKVRFEGLENQLVGPYNFNDVIDIPIATNLASIQE